MAYGDFKDLARRTASEKNLKDKAFNIAKNPKYDRYQRALAFMVYKFLIKGMRAVVLIRMQIVKSCWPKNYANQLLKIKKKTVYFRFKDNIWVADLADMQLISKFNKGFRFLLCVTGIFSKYAWVVRLKDKKGITITNAFQKF